MDLLGIALTKLEHHQIIVINNCILIIFFFAELISFIYKKTTDKKIQTKFIQSLFAHVSKRSDQLDRLQKNKLIYFLSCFGFEVLKGFQDNLETNFNVVLNQIIKAIGAGTQSCFENDTTSIYMNMFRLIQFKFMKSELRFRQKNRSDFSKTFIEAYKELQKNNSEFVQNVIIELLIDRLLFRNLEVFGELYVLFSLQFFGTINSSHSKLSVLFSLLFQKLSVSYINEFTAFFKTQDNPVKYNVHNCWRIV